MPPGAPDYRGSYLRVFVEDGKWNYDSFSDSSGGPPQAAPGGDMECTLFEELKGRPEPRECSASIATVTDRTGMQYELTRPMEPDGVINVMTGFIGNVAQSNNSDRFLDVFKTFAVDGKSFLSQTHVEPAAPLRRGPLAGEAFAHTCLNWAPEYVTREVYSESDIAVTASVDADKARCFITGITGAWSSTRSDGTVQPYAKIRRGASGEWRLPVAPDTTNRALDRVGAFASCIRIN